MSSQIFEVFQTQKKNSWSIFDVSYIFSIYFHQNDMKTACADFETHVLWIDNIDEA